MNDPVLGGSESQHQPAAEITPDPAPAPAPTGAPTSGGDKSAFDLAKLNEGVRAFGDHRVESVDDVLDILRSFHGGMKQAQESNAQAQARLRKLEPFIAGKTPAQSPEYDPSEVDPTVRSLQMTVADMQHRDAYKEMKDGIENLARDPRYAGFITDDIKRDLALECANTENYNPKAVFLAKYEEALLTHTARRAANEAVETIRRNAAAGAGLGSPTTAVGGSAPIDPATLPPEQQAQYVENEVMRILKDSKYADAIVADMQKGSETGW